MGDGVELARPLRMPKEDLSARWRREENERELVSVDASNWLACNVIKADARNAVRSLVERIAELIANEGLREKLLQSLGEDDDLFTLSNQSFADLIKPVLARPAGGNNRRRLAPMEIRHKFAEALQQHPLLVADVESRQDIGPFQLLRLLYRSIADQHEPFDAIADVFFKLRARVWSDGPGGQNAPPPALKPWTAGARIGCKFSKGSPASSSDSSSSAGASAAFVSDRSLGPFPDPPQYCHGEVVLPRWRSKVPVGEACVTSGKSHLLPKPVRNSIEGLGVGSLSADSQRPSILDMLRTLEDDSLVRAAARSYMVELRGRIAQGQSLSVRHSQLGYTSLHAAVEFGQPLAVHELIQAGAPLDSRIAPNSRTPLHYAAQHGRVELAKDLLNAGAARSVLDSDGRRPWHYIADAPELQGLMQLLKDGPSRVAAVAMAKSSSNELLIRFSECQSGYDQAPVEGYTVECEQTSPHEVNPDYVRTKSVLVPFGTSPELLAGGGGAVDDRGKLEDTIVHPSKPDVDLKRQMSEMEDCDGGVGVIRTAHGVNFSEEGYRITGLSADTTYVVRVRAVSIAGHGKWSPTCQMRTMPTVPSPPGKPFVVKTSATSVTVGWLPPPYENGTPSTTYEFQRLIAEHWAIPADTAIEYPSAGTEANENIEGALATTHSTSRSDNQEARSENATNLLHGLPCSRGWLSADEDHTPMNWSAIPAKEWMRYRMKPSSEPIFTVAGFNKNSHLLFRVRAHNENGWSAWSSIGGPYRAVDFIYVVDVTERSAMVRWRDFPSVVTYEWEVQRRFHTGPPCDEQYETVEVVKSSPEMRALCGGLRPGSLFMFRVRPRDRYGWRPWVSGMVTDVVRTADAAPDAPDVPTYVEAEATASSVMVTWVPGWCNGPPIEGFLLDIMKDGKTWELCADLTTESLAKCYRVSGLRAGCEHYFRIKARNRLGWSIYSGISDPIYTNDLAPPARLRVATHGVSWLEVVWEPPAPGILIQQYELQSRPNGVDQHGEPVQWGTISAEIKECRMMVGCASGMKFEFRVRGLTLFGWSTFTDPTPLAQTKRRF